MTAAVRDLTQALNLNPSFARAQNLLGNIAQRAQGFREGPLVVQRSDHQRRYLCPVLFQSRRGRYGPRVLRQRRLGLFQRHQPLFGAASTPYLAQAYCGRAEAFMMKGDADMSRRDREKAESLSAGVCVEEKQTGPRWGKGEIRPQ